MKRILNALGMGLLLTVMTSGTVWAQATAQISGTITDPTGALIPGVEVTATQTDTGVSRTVVTNETGSYILPALPLGPYQLEATLPGFQTFSQTGIVLQVGASPVIPVVLQVGQVTQTIEVEANAALVETRNLSIGQVMETERIAALPLNGRNVQELLLLGGGASQAIDAGGYSFPGRLTITSAGSLGFGTEYTLDGIRHVDAYDGVALPLPFPDALQEFKSEIGGQGAGQRRSTQVSSVTKSGTNEFHGNAFWFVRNDLLNAREHKSQTNSTLKRNQYGGTIGGPLLENKLFFFGGYQGTILRRDPENEEAFVPSNAMLRGDFRELAGTACNRRAFTLNETLPDGTPSGFINNMIDPALFSPTAVNLAARLPSTDDPCGEIVFGIKEIEDQHQFVVKVDFQMNDKHSLFTRFVDSYLDEESPIANNNILTGGGDQFFRSYAWTGGSTYIVTPNIVNSYRMSVSANRRLSIPVSLFSMTELGSDVYSGYIPNTADIVVDDGFELGSNHRLVRTVLYQIADDVSWVRGSHQIGFGGRLGHSRTSAMTGNTRIPSFNVSGGFTGAGLADLMLGKVNDFTQSSGNGNFSRNNHIEMYLTDTWQAKPRLTLTGGLRWSPILAMIDVRRPIPLVSNFDIDRYRQGIRSTVFDNSPPGFVYAGDPELQQWTNMPGAEKPRANVWDNYWNTWGPRVGFAWDIQGDGRSSLRSSYSLSYEEYPAIYGIGSRAQQPPWGSLTRLLQPEGGLDAPWLGIPGGNPHPITQSKEMAFVPFGAYLPNEAELVPTYTQSWNLSLQRELVPGSLLSVSYMGTQIVHLQTAKALNRAIFVPGVGDASGNCFRDGAITHFTVNPGQNCSGPFNTQDRRVLTFENPEFGGEIGRLAQIENGSTQNYHGMLIRLQHRAGENLNLNVNYTLSHCIGDFIGRTNSGYGSSVDHTFVKENDRKYDRGNCEQDERHAFNFTSLVQTPEFANRTLRLIGSGWRLSTIYRASTGGNTNRANQASGIRTVTLGRPASGQGASSGLDRCLCDIGNQRPNILMDDFYLDRSGDPDSLWLNKDAFGTPEPGTFGDFGRVNVLLPYEWDFDVALARIFNIGETQSLEIRAEAYNVTNSWRPDVAGRNSINLDLSSRRFGLIRRALAPRIMQFALKYTF